MHIPLTIAAGQEFENSHASRSYFQAAIFFDFSILVPAPCFDL